MKIKDGKEESYLEWKNKQNDPFGYGLGCFRYAERWASLMENEMEKGIPLSECAKELSHTADTEGITGAMYGMAVSILSEAWEHGEELRRWHNLKTQIANEGEVANENGGVLNPALLRIQK